MITLYNVTDRRNGRHYSVAVVKEQDAKYFIVEQ